MWKIVRRDVLRPVGVFVKVFCTYQLITEYIGGIRMVNGPSMLPTFSTSTEFIIEDTASVRLFPKPLQRGELATFNSPRAAHAQICKRVIGLPGDIVCVDPTGQRGGGLKEKYVKVPEGHVWIAGDNAAASRDSRDYGPVPIGLLHSRVVAKFWPWSTRKIFRDESRTTSIP